MLHALAPAATDGARVLFVAALKSPNSSFTASQSANKSAIAFTFSALPAASAFASFHSTSSECSFSAGSRLARAMLILLLPVAVVALFTLACVSGTWTGSGGGADGAGAAYCHLVEAGERAGDGAGDGRAERKLLIMSSRSSSS